MVDNDLLQTFKELISRIEAYAYERGKADAKRELLAFLGSTDAEITAAPAPVRDENVDVPVAQLRPAAERQRAPKGIVRALIIRTLAREPGLTPNEILDRAEGEFEQMIAPASVRAELRNGRRIGKYRDEFGRWSLASASPEKEAGTPGKAAPASNPVAERG